MCIVTLFPRWEYQPLRILLPFPRRERFIPLHGKSVRYYQNATYPSFTSGDAGRRTYNYWND